MTSRPVAVALLPTHLRLGKDIWNQWMLEIPATTVEANRERFQRAVALDGVWAAACDRAWNERSEILGGQRPGPPETLKYLIGAEGDPVKAFAAVPAEELDAIVEAALGFVPHWAQIAMEVGEQDYDGFDYRHGQGTDAANHLVASVRSRLGHDLNAAAQGSEVDLDYYQWARRSAERIAAEDDRRRVCDVDVPELSMAGWYRELLLEHIPAYGAVDTGEHPCLPSWLRQALAGSGLSKIGWDITIHTSLPIPDLLQAHRPDLALETDRWRQDLLEQGLAEAYYLIAAAGCTPVLEALLDVEASGRFTLEPLSLEATGDGASPELIAAVDDVLGRARWDDEQLVNPALTRHTDLEHHTMGAPR